MGQRPLPDDSSPVLGISETDKARLAFWQDCLTVLTVLFGVWYHSLFTQL